MKAVYVLKKMPSVCMKCPFCQFYAYGMSAETYCILTAKRNEDGINTKAEWCPLRPLPMKKETDETEPFDVYMYKTGWNLCLEAMGEIE